MKAGKYVQLSAKDNVSLSYGSVNSKQLKSVFLRLQCWVAPKKEDRDWDMVITKIRREVRLCAYHHIDTRYFGENYIVDLDLRSSGIVSSKRSFLSCEITLFTRGPQDIKGVEFSALMETLAAKVLQSSPTLFREFSVYEKKA